MTIRTYTLIVESLLLVVLTFIVALVIYSWVSGSPSHDDIQTGVRSLQEQVTILNCQVNAPSAIERSQCIELVVP